MRSAKIYRLGFTGSTLCVQLEAVPSEHAAALADLGDRRRPVAVLPDRELEPVLRTGARGKHRGEDEREREVTERLHRKTTPPMACVSSQLKPRGCHRPARPGDPVTTALQ
jgi:hypothetical protein